MSSLIMIKGSFKTRFEAKDFCVEVIELLKEAKVPALWVMKWNYQEQTPSQKPSAIDLLKHLTSQALSLAAKYQTEQSLALSTARFHSAVSEDEWFALLGSIIGSISHTCLVIDVETLSSHFSNMRDGFSWPVAFLKLFEQLKDRGLKTVVKVMMVSYGSSVFLDSSHKDVRDLVVPIKMVPKKIASSRSRGLGRGATNRGGHRRSPKQQLAFHSPRKG